MGKKTNEEPELKDAKVEKEEAKVEKTAAPIEEVYTAEEFYRAARTLWGVAPELVRAALRCKGVTKCTKEEARKIVEEFKNKEVK